MCTNVKFLRHQGQTGKSLPMESMEWQQRCDLPKVCKWTTFSPGTGLPRSKQSEKDCIQSVLARSKQINAEKMQMPSSIKTKGHHSSTPIIFPCDTEQKTEQESTMQISSPERENTDLHQHPNQDTLVDCDPSYTNDLDLKQTVQQNKIFWKFQKIFQKFDLLFLYWTFSITIKTR